VRASLGGPRKSIGTDHSHTDRILGPYNLLDDGDTLDKVDMENLPVVMKTVSEIIKNFMVMT
jgi:hypothetical protein